MWDDTDERSLLVHCWLVGKTERCADNNIIDQKKKQCGVKYKVIYENENGTLRYCIFNEFVQDYKVYYDKVN